MNEFGFSGRMIVGYDEIVIWQEDVGGGVVPCAVLPPIWAVVGSVWWVLTRGFDISDLQAGRLARLKRKGKAFSHGRCLWCGISGCCMITLLQISVADGVFLLFRQLECVLAGSASGSFRSEKRTSQQCRYNSVCMS